MNRENPEGKRLLRKYRRIWDYNSKLVERYRRGSCKPNSPGLEYRLVAVKPTGPPKDGEFLTSRGASSLSRIPLRHAVYKSLREQAHFTSKTNSTK